VERASSTDDVQQQTEGCSNKRSGHSRYVMRLPLATPFSAALPPPFAAGQADGSCMFDAAEQPGAAKALMRACTGEAQKVSFLRAVAAAYNRYCPADIVH